MEEIGPGPQKLESTAWEKILKAQKKLPIS
jgi:hypothetical protein